MTRSFFLALASSAAALCSCASPRADAANLPPPPPPADTSASQSTAPPPPPQDQPPPDAATSQSPSAEAPPPQGAQVEPESGTPAGQWVSTSEYGWLYIPYSAEYTYIPADARVFPDQFVYYPAYGWRWVVAPWVYGYGPAPYWGPLGPTYFVWYSHPWYRVGGYWGWGRYRGWGHYRGWIGPRTWGSRGWAGAPRYYRDGVGGPHPDRHFRTAPAPNRGRAAARAGHR